MLSSLIQQSKSKKIKVKAERMMELKRYYMSLYRCYAFQLYDLGYIEDPTYFLNCKKQILKNFDDMGILQDITSDIGRVSLNSDAVYYALCKNRGDDEIYEFLSIVYNMLVNREYAQKIDNLYEEYKFEAASYGIIKITMGCMGEKVSQKSNIAFDIAFARCISDISTSTECISINDKIWDIAMKELGIPESDWYLDGIFDGRLSHDDEVSCLKGILNGNFNTSGGKYVDSLNSWLDSHIRSVIQSTMNTKMLSLGLYDSLYRQSKGIFAILNNVVSELTRQGVNVLAVEEDKIYYNKPREFIDFPYGVFSVVCDEEDYILPLGNSLNGYSGELYTPRRLKEEHINYAGCPIMLTGMDGASMLLYDLEQTDIETSYTWFTENVSEYSFDDDQSVSNMPETTLAEKLYKGYCFSKTSSKSLISRIPYDGDSWKNIGAIKKSLFNKIE